MTDLPPPLPPHGYLPATPGTLGYNSPGLVEKTDEHLRILVICHFVLAGLTALCACIPIIHVIIGIVMLNAPSAMTRTPSGPPEAFMGWFFIGFGSCFILGGWTLALLVFLSGLNLKRRRRFTFCMVISFLMCLQMPIGTVLGVFTLVTLFKPGVKERFT